MMKYACLFVLTLSMLACGGYGSNSMTGGGTGLPSISALAPATTTAGSAAFVLTVNGSGFGTDSIVYFNGVVHSTSFVTANQVTANVTASDVAMAGTFAVYVHTGVYSSNMMNFTVQ